MQYSLKDKIHVTDNFLNELMSKSWQEVEAIQQQIANIDTSTMLGSEVTKLLKNICTCYYVLIGSLESLSDSASKTEPQTEKIEPDVDKAVEPEDFSILPTADTAEFEPFEYFVDFDEPSGIPLSDKDLYGN